MSHNYVREWREFEHLCELPQLEDLVFIGNPLEEDLTSSGKYNDEVRIKPYYSSNYSWRDFSVLASLQIIKRLLYLRKLDGFPVIRENEEEATEEVLGTLDIEEINRMAEDSDEEDEATKAPSDEEV